MDFRAWKSQTYRFQNRENSRVIKKVCRSIKTDLNSVKIERDNLKNKKNKNESWLEVNSR